MFAAVPDSVAFLFEAFDGYVAGDPPASVFRAKETPDAGGFWRYVPIREPCRGKTDFLYLMHKTARSGAAAAGTESAGNGIIEVLFPKPLTGGRTLSVGFPDTGSRPRAESAAV